MAKFTPGIPESFTLDVPPVEDLRDYLDEPPPRPKPVARPPAERTKTVAAPPPTVAPRTAVSEVGLRAAMPGEARTRPVSAPVPVTSPPAQIASPSQPLDTLPEGANEDRPARPKAPRREISMSHETLRMSDELLEFIRSGSGQRDTTASELFHGLVLLVHEAMAELDTHAIPKRGRWGTPTARAYPLELRNAFRLAVLKKFGTAVL